MFDQTRGGFGHHHAARRRHRLHPLRESHRLARRGVAQRSRTDLADDHQPRVQADPHPEFEAVTAGHLGGESIRLLLDGQRGQTGPKSVVLQGNRGAEQCHHPVAGVLDAAGAEPAGNRRRPFQQIGHDLAEPFRIQGRRDPHRTDHVGEERCHLFVGGRRRRGYQGRPTCVTEPRAVARFGAATLTSRC